MDPIREIENLEWLRREIIGRNAPIETPFGTRPLVYADFTASGRGVRFIENYLRELLRFYANSHTEDDYTGETMTRLLHEAEASIKKQVNAGPAGKIVFSGNGATGAITRLQQILGVYWPPATKSRVDGFLQSCSSGDGSLASCVPRLEEAMERQKPVVFVGPYEHHSNEISWRESFCEVSEVPLDSHGALDIEALEAYLTDPRWEGRQKIGSFSAASNVSGRRTPIYEVAALLHRYGALAIFDFAAAAPYVEIDMNHDDDSWFDAIVLSPHKFLGGPGSSGLLVFNERIYRTDLPPSVAGGGTVDYVNRESERYTDDIETREKPGTPGILQAIKASLAFSLKERVGVDRIENIERFFLEEFWRHLGDRNEFVFYTSRDPRDVSIVAFNIRHDDLLLHPKFVTRLMNDLFGIQTRAGCSCAGPYGHALLGIDGEQSRRYACLIDEGRWSGFKPGWVRLNLHWSMSMEEFSYLLGALDWLGQKARDFLPFYVFDPVSGEWRHRSDRGEPHLRLSLDDAIKADPPVEEPVVDLSMVLEEYLSVAEAAIQTGGGGDDYFVFPEEVTDLAWFKAVHTGA